MSRFSFPTFACMLCAIALAAEEPAPEPLWDSIPEAWRGEALATREWQDPDGQTQRMDLCRKASGERFYILHAVSTVCGDAGKASSCKLHLFSACFDEMGRFIGYRVENEHPFTRAKHQPFAPADYKTLDGILRDPLHVLGTIATRARGVDAVSGATVKYVAEQAVPGAYYTSKAVWDIAQEKGPGKAQAWTLSRLSAEDVRTWRTNGETLKLWWFLDHAEKCALPEETRRDLAYDLLTQDQPDVQAAAIRYLHRTGAPFRPERAMDDRYAQMDDIVKPDFLAWWRRHGHAPEPLIDAVLKDLRGRVDRYSHVTAHAVDFLTAMKCTDNERCRAVLQALSERSPSTYIRGLAKRALASER